MIRVVLNTNVVVSALNRGASSPGTDGLVLTLQLLQEIGANRYKVLLTNVPPAPEPGERDARRAADSSRRDGGRSRKPTGELHGDTVTGGGRQAVKKQ